MRMYIVWNISLFPSTYDWPKSIKNSKAFCPTLKAFAYRPSNSSPPWKPLSLSQPMNHSSLYFTWLNNYNKFKPPSGNPRVLRIRWFHKATPIRLTYSKLAKNIFIERALDRSNPGLRLLRYYSQWQIRYWISNETRKAILIPNWGWNAFLRKTPVFTGFRSGFECSPLSGENWKV